MMTEFYRIKCDTCGKIHDYTDAYASVLKRALKDGWTESKKPKLSEGGFKHYCPRCSKEKK